MVELPGKAQRVMGIFLFMVGGGLILESTATSIGAAIMSTGAVMFLWGARLAAPRTTARTTVPTEHPL